MRIEYSDGFYHMRNGEELRVAAAGRVNTALANAGWPKAGSAEEKQIMWDCGVPARTLFTGSAA